jgi:hypothetical protein
MTSVNSLLCQASICFSHGLEVSRHRSTPTEMQSMSEHDFDYLVSTV